MVDFGAYEASGDISGPFLGLLIGVPLSLAVWAIGAGLALIAF